MALALLKFAPMHNIKSLLLATGALVLAQLLSGCGALELFKLPKVKTYTYSNKEDAQTVFNGSTVSCQGSCPEHVGGLVSYTESYYSYSIGVCSLTLISKGLALTNRHCIPSDLRYEGALCKGRMRVKLPAAAGLGSADFECFRVERIAAWSSENSIEPDWAVVSLGHSSTRVAATINPAGIGDATSLTLYPVFYSVNNMRAHGTVKKVECTSSFGSSKFFDYFSEFSRVFRFESCDRNIIEGNSGTGVHNPAGEIVGVISNILGDGTQDLETFGSTRGAGTNLACIDHFNTDAAINCR